MGAAVKRLLVIVDELTTRCLVTAREGPLADGGFRRYAPAAVPIA